MRDIRASMLVLAFMAAFLTPPPSRAATPNDPSGCWDGTIIIKPGEREIDIVVEFTRGPDGAWSGVMSVPTQHVSRKPLEDVAVDDTGKVSWIYRDAAGLSILTGSLSADGLTITGEHQEQGQKYPLRLSRVTPGSEPPLPSLTDLSGVEELRSLFNRDSGKTRLLLILAPSCGLCQEGAQLVERYVLDKLARKDLAVYAIWVPVSPQDDRQAAVAVSSHLTDSRVRHFWAGNLEIPRSFSAPLGLGETLAWDVYLLYGPDKSWVGTAPLPDSYMHRLGKQLPRERLLNAIALAEEVERIYAAPGPIRSPQVHSGGASSDPRQPPDAGRREQAQPRAPGDPQGGGS